MAQSIKRILLTVCFVLFLSYSTVSASEDFIPITLDNASQIKLLTTITDYRDPEDYCACDVRFFSQNGRTIATDWKVIDLATGDTINLEGQGYPLALSPDGAYALVSGQNHGTRLLDIA